MKYIKNLIKSKNIYPLIIFIVLLICKTILVYNFASNIPYWDQWGCILYNLLKPFEEGRLTISWLFATHGEHYIFFTKLTTLSFYYFFDGWYPVREIFFNCILHSLSILIFLSLIYKYISQKKLFFCFSLLLFLTSFSWENLLWGFQSHFHFVSIFGFLGIFLTMVNSKLTLKWFIGLVFLILSFFSSGGGIIFTLSVFISYIFMSIVNFSANKEIFLQGGLLLCVLIIEYILTPNFEPHHFLRAETISDFFKACDFWSSWPVNIQFSGFIIHLPSFFFLIFKRKKIVKGKDKYILALIIWSFIQIATMSFARAGIPNPFDQGNRYLDHLTYSICINFVVILMFFPRKIKTVSFFVWSFIILISSLNNLYGLKKSLTIKKEQSATQKKNITSFLGKNDTTFLYNKAAFDLPSIKVFSLKRSLTDSTSNKIIKKTLKIKD